jgi:hypothetical protein
MKVKNTKKRNTDIFIKDCIDTIGNLYDYSLVEYINNKQKVKIICKKHGIFEQSPNNHLSKRQSCPKCSEHHHELKTTIQIVLDFQKKQGDKYNYSKVNYIGSKQKVEIICKKHGSFFQTPNNHLKGQDCPKCVKVNIDDFKNKSNIKHNYKYNYDLVIYENCRNKVKIICGKHGLFEQVASSHLYGIGCPSCQESKGENKIRKILEENNIEYISQYSFDGCKLKKKLRFDFYLPILNTCIEFDGLQHFKPIKYYGGVTEFKVRVERDKIKSEFCYNEKINLLRIRFDDNIKNKLNFIYEKEKV